MKYLPPFRIETDKAFEYSKEHDAYLFVGTNVSLGKSEWAQIIKANNAYEKRYNESKNIKEEN